MRPCSLNLAVKSMILISDESSIQGTKLSQFVNLGVVS